MTLYEYWTGTGFGLRVYCAAAQTFISPVTFTLTEVQLKLAKNSGQAATIATIYLYAVDDEHKPTGPSLLTIGSITNDDLTTSYIWKTFTDLNYLIEATIEYAIVIVITGDAVCVTGTIADSGVRWEGKSGYTNGVGRVKYCAKNGDWACQDFWSGVGIDWTFKTIGEPPTNFVFLNGSSIGISIISADLSRCYTQLYTKKKIRIARGLLDTKPSAHLAEARIWFVSFTDFTVPIVCKDFIAGDSPRVKFLTKTGKNILTEELATEENTNPTYLAFNNRMIRPYLPGNFKINNKRFPKYLYGQPTLTWSHRDRTHQDQIRNFIRHTDNTDYGPEDGVTYTVQFLTKAGVIKRTVTGLTGKTYTFTAEDEVTYFGKPQHKLRIKLWAVRNGYNSWQIYDTLAERPLYGTISAIAVTTGNLVGIQELIGSLIGECGVAPGTEGALKVTPKVLAGNFGGQAETFGDLTEE